MDPSNNHPASSPRLHGAIIGLGRMGLTHLSILNHHPAVESLSVVESSACFGKAVEKSLGVTCYRDTDELFAAGIPDFMVIATPTSSHSSIATMALQHRVHTFIEKPLSTSATASATLARLANEQGVVVQVGYVNRFNEIFQAVRRLIQSGEIGAPTHISCEIRSPMVSKTTGTSWRSKRSEGGGCLSDIATHGIDLMNFLVGSPSRVIAASLQTLVSSDVDDRVDAFFGYEGYTGELHVNWSDPSCRKPAYRLNIDTEDGRIIADQHAYKVFKRTPSAHGVAGEWKTVYITDIAQPVRIYVRGNEFTRQLDEFVDSVVSKQHKTISDFSSALAVDQIVEQIRECGEIVRVQ
jgi:scyllo-inositol 2-dehydrogenase (NADP+)